VANKPCSLRDRGPYRAGIRDIGIIVGDTKAEIREAVGDGERWGKDVRIAYIEQPEPLGLAHAVLVAEGFLGREPFVMYLGDNILKSGIVSLVEQFREQKPNALILLTPVPNPRMFVSPSWKTARSPGWWRNPWNRRATWPCRRLYVRSSYLRGGPGDQALLEE